MALHSIGEARQALFDVLAPLLDEGRVAPYPRPHDVGVQVWIGDDRGRANRGTSAITIDIDFPVHVTYDGTDEAQVAGIDDLVSRIWDACERTKGMYPVDWFPSPDLTGPSGTRRHSIVNVRHIIGARTFCPPDAPGTSPIPPDKTQE